MATFTKQHFQAVAHLLRFRIERARERISDLRPIGDYRTRLHAGAGLNPAVCVRDMEDLAKSFAALFAEGNQRFDRVRFLTACGIEQG